MPTSKMILRIPSLLLPLSLAAETESFFVNSLRLSLLLESQEVSTFAPHLRLEKAYGKPSLKSRQHQKGTRLHLSNGAVKAT